jgi:hypothetical protein
MSLPFLRQHAEGTFLFVLVREICPLPQVLEHTDQELHSPITAPLHEAPHDFVLQGFSSSTDSHFCPLLRGETTISRRLVVIPPAQHCEHTLQLAQEESLQSTEHGFKRQG